MYSIKVVWIMVSLFVYGSIYGLIQGLKLEDLKGKIKVMKDTITIY